MRGSAGHGSYDFGRLVPLESVIITTFITPGMLSKPWKPLKARHTELLRKLKLQISCDLMSPTLVDGTGEEETSTGGHVASSSLSFPASTCGCSLCSPQGASWPMAVCSHHTSANIQASRQSYNKDQIIVGPSGLGITSGPIPSHHLLLVAPAHWLL